MNRFAELRATAAVHSAGRLIAGSQEGKCSRAFRSCFQVQTQGNPDGVALTAYRGRGCKAVPYHNQTHLNRAIRTSFATFRSFDAPVRATIQAMGSARKPVIVRKFSREWYAGYAAAFGQESTALEVLDLHGKVLTIAWE